MHERSLVGRLLEQVQGVLDENDAQAATSIEVEIGPMSGVEPELVRLAFEQLTEAAPWSGTGLVITESSLVIHCNDCGSATELERFVFRCSSCRSGRVRVVHGDEFRLMSVTVEEVNSDNQNTSEVPCG